MGCICAKQPDEFSQIGGPLEASPADEAGTLPPASAGTFGPGSRRLQQAAKSVMEGFGDPAERARKDSFLMAVEALQQGRHGPVQRAMIRHAAKSLTSQNLLEFSGDGHSTVGPCSRENSATAAVPPAGVPEGVLRFVGTWRAAGVEGRDEFLKAMALPWVLRQIAAALPQPDCVITLDEEGVLVNECTVMGFVSHDRYLDGLVDTKTTRGVTSTTTFRWDGGPGEVLTFQTTKQGAPDEEVLGRRWIEADGTTMVSESKFRKNASKPWATLRRLWTLDPASRDAGAAAAGLG